MLSKELILEYGVPQGAVLGPMFFVQYMTPLEDIITRHNMNSVIFADDSQLYVVCDSRTDYSVLTSIEACVNEIRCWMRANMLALNDGKTEVVWFSSKYKKTSERAVTTDVRIGDVTVSASSKVETLVLLLIRVARWRHRCLVYVAQRRIHYGGSAKFVNFWTKK